MTQGGRTPATPARDRGGGETSDRRHLGEAEAFSVIDVMGPRRLGRLEHVAGVTSEPEAGTTPHVIYHLQFSPDG